MAFFDPISFCWPFNIFSTNQAFKYWGHFLKNWVKNLKKIVLKILLVFLNSNLNNGKKLHIGKTFFK